MRKLRIALLLGSLSLVGGCENFLDVNTNPNAPERVAANLYLPPMIHWMVATQHWDGRFTGQYTQQLTPTTVSNWDRMGYLPSSDQGGEHWRTAYFVFGQNLIDMMTIAEQERRWDILGVGYVLKGWMWGVGASLHGEMIVSEAFDQTRFSFNYDSEQFVYQEALRMLDSATIYLARTDGAVDATYLARGDRLFGGSRARWTQFAHGLRAMLLHHGTNKATYDPAAVIAAVDRSFTSSAEDAIFVFPNTQNDDRNFLARSRNNFTTYRQTQFVVGLLDGSVFGVRDPRINRMLSPAPDGQYRGMDPNFAETAIPVNQRPGNPYGYAATGGLNLPGLYVFDDAARIPAMSYAQLQFIKAEAAYRMGDKTTALAAYRNGITSHMDFVNSNVRDNDRNAYPTWPTAISAAERAAFLADPRIVPTSPADLTLTQIMSQKYIAQWGWAFNEQWMDMRRFGYVGLDPETGAQVYPGFTPPTNLFPDNAGKLAYRLRPRFNSEYVWNQDGLRPIGGLELDFHTKPLWILQP